MSKQTIYEERKRNTLLLFLIGSISINGIAWLLSIFLPLRSLPFLGILLTLTLLNGLAYFAYHRHHTSIASLVLTGGLLLTLIIFVSCLPSTLPAPLSQQLFIDISAYLIFCIPVGLAGFLFSRRLIIITGLLSLVAMCVLMQVREPALWLQTVILPICALSISTGLSLLVTRYTDLIQSLLALREQTDHELHYLHAQNAQLADNSRFKEQLLSVINHELRTPMSVAKGYIEILHTYGAQLDNELRERYIAQISKACSEVSQLVDSATDSMRPLEEQQIPLQCVTLKQSVDEVITAFTPRILEEQRTVTLHIDQDISVMSDPFRLRQVLNNLLINAMNYSKPGTSIEIKASHANPHSPAPPSLPTCSPSTDLSSTEMVYLAIKDSGIGIPQHEQERLFQPFVRLDNARSMAARGSGLGLFLCKRLITSMNGQIWIESDGMQDKGTTIWISLPHC